MAPAPCFCSTFPFIVFNSIFSSAPLPIDTPIPMIDSIDYGNITFIHVSFQHTDSKVCKTSHLFPFESYIIRVKLFSPKELT